MNVLIVDDEKPARERLRNLIQDMNLGEVVGEASNGREALTETDRVHPDILLLDIRMPEMDGLETASHLSKLENPPAVIFTTAYNDYALQAFEQQAVDYLLKPVRRERLERALAAARRLTRVQLSALRSNDPQGRTHISAIPILVSIEDTGNGIKAITILVDTIIRDLGSSGINAGYSIVAIILIV